MMHLLFIIGCVRPQIASSFPSPFEPECDILWDETSSGPALGLGAEVRFRPPTENALLDESATIFWGSVERWSSFEPSAVCTLVLHLAEMSADLCLSDGCTTATASIVVAEDGRMVHFATFDYQQIPSLEVRLEEWLPDGLSPGENVVAGWTDVDGRYGLERQTRRTSVTMELGTIDVDYLP